MLKRKYVVNGDRMIIAIGYKYNARNLLYFIDTVYRGIPQAGILYLSKYTEPFANVDTCPVALPIVMYKFFG